MPFDPFLCNAQVDDAYNPMEETTVWQMIWADDIPSPQVQEPSLTCEQFAAMMECTVDELWAM